MKFLREPLVQFLFLGGLIYLAYGLFAPETEEDTSRNIVVNKAKVQWMKASWEKRRNRLPTQEELDGVIGQYVKETILYNEAIKMGLDKDDGMIRRRLAQKVEFLAKDLVVYTPPTEQDLKKYYDEHQDKYTPDATYTFMQIYFNPDPKRQAIVDSWPADIDDSAARNDWNWKPEYDAQTASQEYLLKNISKQYNL